MLKIELLLSVFALLLAVAFPRLGVGGFERIEAKFRRFAEHETLSVVAVGILAVVARVAVLPILPIPAPTIHDEFGYLLLADTFAHARLTNPTHPMWIHFETFCEIQKPTYCSAFYPAQGIFLALGQVAFGHPFWGVVLSSALMCAAICWMLQGWISPGWALLGGILAVIRLGMFSYWSNSYWGGAVAALGGALVFGSLPRVQSDLSRLCGAIWMGIGLAILFNSRPYESLFFALPVGIGVLAWIFQRNGPPSSRVLTEFMIPLGVLLFATLSAMAYYFWRTTGSIFNTPYLVNVQTYFKVPNFAWLPLRQTPVYRNSVIRDFYLGFPVQYYKAVRDYPFRHVIIKLVDHWTFFIGPVFVLPLLALLGPQSLRGAIKWWVRPTAFAALTYGVSLIGILLPVPYNPHYAAPIVCVTYLLLLQGMRRMRSWCVEGRPVGKTLSRAVPIICVLMLVIGVALPSDHIGVPNLSPPNWSTATAQNTQRLSILRTLNTLPKQQLVIVRYGQNHVGHNEWVFNCADIDHAQVVWARDLGSTLNKKLIAYFANREVSLIEPDERTPIQKPYYDR